MEDLELLIELFLQNPDSPLGLKIQSSVSQALAPRQKICDDVVSSMVAFEQCPSDDNRVALLRAIERWETMDGEDARRKMPEDIRFGFEQDACAIIEQRKRMPPAMDCFLQVDFEPIDVAYEVVGSLHGVSGSWHRLWASLCRFYQQCSFDTSKSELLSLDDACVVEVKRQFETAFGRAITKDEWTLLDRAAHEHTVTFLIPKILSKISNGD